MFIYGTDSDNTYLSTAAVTAASTSTSWIPSWAYTEAGLTGYTGNVINGFGGAIAITSTAKGLQYVDAGFPLGVICKGPLGLSALPPKAALPSTDAAPPADMTDRSTGNYTFFPISATLYMTLDDCTKLKVLQTYFKFRYSNTTAAAWNSIQATSATYIKWGDVVPTATSPDFTKCIASTGRKLSATQGSTSGPSIGMAASVNLPPGYTVDQANAARSQFETAAVKAYTSGQFAADFGVTGADVTVSPAQVATYTAPSSSSSSNTLALGLGVGLGVGVPVIAGLAFAAYYFTKKRGDQEVAPA